MPLRRHLPGHLIDTAYERGWAGLANGDLIAAAERDGYGLLITTDQNLRYQQNFKDRQLAILVLLSTSWPRIQLHLDTILDAINAVVPGAYQEVAISR